MVIFWSWCVTCEFYHGLRKNDFRSWNHCISWMKILEFLRRLKILEYKIPFFKDLSIKSKCHCNSINSSNNLGVIHHRLAFLIDPFFLLLWMLSHEVQLTQILCEKQLMNYLIQKEIYILIMSMCIMCAYIIHSIRLHNGYTKAGI